MDLRNKTVEERRSLVEQTCSVTLNSVASATVDGPEQVHCENQIGAISLPLGVAGPIKINGEHLHGERLVPLATSEGALVASVSRGSKAISLSGGANVNEHLVGTTRGPVFYTTSLQKRQELYAWIKNNKPRMAELAESTSSHLTFKDVEVRGTAEYLFARFKYDTSEAMGMNMVTIATQKIVEEIEKETGVVCLAVAGNFDIDKKPAWLNFINSRGRKVWAEAVITKDVLESVLKTTAQQVFDVWLAKCMIGSAMAGSMGFNCHFANIVAAFYAATGQDLAHVVEGSAGITTTKVLGDDLYVSVYLPAVMVGSVGGGTKLKTQTEARSVSGCKTAAELAELLGAAVLAGELSLLSSLSVHTLASSHKQLGR